MHSHHKSPRKQESYIKRVQEVRQTTSLWQTKQQTTKVKRQVLG